MPFNTNHTTDHPISFYAATKKSNEIMAHSYSYMYKIPTTGLRFFTVYGPYGRPDMALFKFAKAIFKNETIEVFNYGKHARDFTYIDDITNSIIKIIKKPAKPDKKWDGFNPKSDSSEAPFKLYNIGNSQPVELMKYINYLEKLFNKKAEKIFLPMQIGDVKKTYADVDSLVEDFKYKPKIDYQQGLNSYYRWFVEYYINKRNGEF
jgi:UDP-glucuronate 4-epimerase